VCKVRDWLAASPTGSIESCSVSDAPPAAVADGTPCTNVGLLRPKSLGLPPTIVPGFSCADAAKSLSPLDWTAIALVTCPPAGTLGPLTAGLLLPLAAG